MDPHDHHTMLIIIIIIIIMVIMITISARLPYLRNPPRIISLRMVFLFLSVIMDILYGAQALSSVVFPLGLVV